MTIGAITRSAKAGENASKPIYADRISFAGDNAYPTGGTAGFQTSLRAAIGDNREIIDVISGDCGDNKVEYDKTNDKLKVRVISTAAEVANTTNLSGTTFNVTVLSK